MSSETWILGSLYPCEAPNTQLQIHESNNVTVACLASDRVRVALVRKLFYSSEAAEWCYSSDGMRPAVHVATPADANANNIFISRFSRIAYETATWMASASERITRRTNVRTYVWCEAPIDDDVWTVWMPNQAGPRSWRHSCRDPRPVAWSVGGITCTHAWRRRFGSARTVVFDRVREGHGFDDERTDGGANPIEYKTICRLSRSVHSAGRHTYKRTVREWTRYSRNRFVFLCHS